MINQDKLYNIAVIFRTAILAAKRNGKFEHRDRMSNFPGGCCDDSCDLLSHYLHTEYDIHTKQRNGTYSDSNPDNTTGHAWLVMDDGTIIDITTDQFEFFFPTGVYVGKEYTFYESLERQQTYDNYNIKQDQRLWKDYQIIKSYIAI